ncbi:MAG: hypothetical protein KGH57_02255 [Candidatus Micrarchaeota archaeon]|nr:hypothetical protein [Candidatus Micrarchaeota archaeon]
MSIGEYGTQEAQHRQIAELKTELLSREAFDVLKGELRKKDSNSVSDVLDRLHYAKRLMHAEDVEELNKKVILKVTRLELLVTRGVIKDEETKEAVVALSEYVLDGLAKKEWEALVLTLDQPRPGLRVAPDLARLLLTEENADDAMKKYRKEAEKAVKAAQFSFKAKAISSIENGKERKGPEHFVPFVESDIDWETGSMRGKYLFMMARYETDTQVNGKVLDFANLVLRPGPEYEPLGAKLRQDMVGRLKLVAGLSRVHWIPYILPIELIETTHDGRLKVTCMPDTSTVIYGHGFVFVTSHPASAYETMLKLNPELHKLTHLGQGEYLRIEMQQAGAWYKEGDKHERVPKTMVLQKVPNGNDALAGNLRQRNEVCCGDSANDKVN